MTFPGLHEPDTDTRPNADWPRVGDTIDVQIGDRVATYHVVGYPEGHAAAVLKNGPDGTPGLYRLIRRDGTDGVIQYAPADTLSRGNRRTYDQNRHVLPDYFNETYQNHE